VYRTLCKIHIPYLHIMFQKMTFACCSYVCFKNKYVSPYFRSEMYAGRIACCPLVSHSEYADGTDIRTDGRTDVRLLHYTFRYGRGRHNDTRTVGAIELWQGIYILQSSGFGMYAYGALRSCCGPSLVDAQS